MKLNAVDTRNFYVGVQLEMLPSGRVAPILLRRRRATVALIAAWRRVTRWWRPRTVVSAIDHERGSITMTTERWSWRRWRWLP